MYWLLEHSRRLHRENLITSEGVACSELYSIGPFSSLTFLTIHDMIVYNNCVYHSHLKQSIPSNKSPIQSLTLSLRIRMFRTVVPTKPYLPAPRTWVNVDHTSLFWQSWIRKPTISPFP